MNITFIMNARMPTEKAHGYQISKMCEAVALSGAKVALIVPLRENNTQGDVFSYYGVRNNFTIEYVPILSVSEFIRGSRIGFYAQASSFLFALRRVNVVCDSVVITRSPEIAWWYGRKGYRVFFDAHSFPMSGTFLLRFLLRNIEGIISNSNGTANAFRENGHSNILIAPNAVDLIQFDNTETKERDALGLPHGRIAMYVGHLYEWKGVSIVVKAARMSTNRDIMFVFVGGTENDLLEYREKTSDLKNVLFLGHCSRMEIPALIKSADVLLLPNIPCTQESILYTSPIKMFEYMASGVPIVASDMPSIREVLNDGNSILVPPGDPKSLLFGIERGFTDEAKRKAAQAKIEVKEYTWNARAQKILNFIKS